MKSFQEFAQLCADDINWPLDEMCRCLGLKLAAARITEQDVEIYINYPEMTVEQLAAHYGKGERSIRRALDRVRRAWSSLQHDPDIHQHGSPALHHMRRIEFHDSSRLDDDGSLIQF